MRSKFKYVITRFIVNVYCLCVFVCVCIYCVCVYAMYTRLAAILYINVKVNLEWVSDLRYSMYKKAFKIIAARCVLPICCCCCLMRHSKIDFYLVRVK